MQKRTLLYWMMCITLGGTLFLTGCDSSKHTLPQSSAATEQTNAPTEMPGDMPHQSTENSSSSETTESPTTSVGGDASSEATPTESVPVVIVPLETEEASTAGSTVAKLETISEIYSENLITLIYPQIIGLKDEDMQEHANTLLREHAESIMKQYVTNPETDFFQLDYEVKTLYRGQISILYTGSYQTDGDDDVTRVRVAENINLIDGKNIRLSQRLTQKALQKIIFDTKDYDIISPYTGDDAALKEYLESQSETFFNKLVEDGDFGGEGYPSCTSYHNGEETTIIIPMPHLFGDYLEIRIIQKSK